MTALPPAIVLCQTQMGENVGAAARAMKNFGLSELRLAAPRSPDAGSGGQALAGGGT
jgi:tRNA/rRNA methyltransferase